MYHGANSPEKRFELLKQLTTEMEKDFNRNQSELNDKCPTAQNIEKLSIGSVLCSIDSYKNKDYYGSAKETSWQDCLKNYLADVNKKYEEMKSKHELNLEAIKVNKKAAEIIKTFMQNCGIRCSWSEWSYTSPTTGRTTRTRHEHTHKAGYIADIERHFKTSDGWNTVEADYKRFLKQAEEYKKKHEALDAEKLKEQQKSEAYKMKLKLIGLFNNVNNTSCTSMKECYDELSKTKDIKKYPEYLVCSVIANASKKEDVYVECKNEKVYLATLTEGYYSFPIWDTPHFLFDEVSDELFGTWRHGTEHILTIKSKLTDKEYSCQYRCQPNEGIVDAFYFEECVNTSNMTMTGEELDEVMSDDSPEEEVLDIENDIDASLEFDGEDDSWLFDEDAEDE